jgi:hypothetical protein
MDSPGAPFCVALNAQEEIAAKGAEKKALEPQQLLGAWVLVGKPGEVTEPRPGARMKFIGERHWAITEADADTGRVIWHHGGTYTLEGNKLVETVLYANDSTAKLVGKEFHSLTLDDGALTWLGDDNRGLRKRRGKRAWAPYGEGQESGGRWHWHLAVRRRKRPELPARCFAVFWMICPDQFFGD